MNSPLNWDFVFCALGFAGNLFLLLMGFLTIFTFQKHFLHLQRNFALGKALGWSVSSRFGPVLDIVFGFNFM